MTSSQPPVPSSEEPIGASPVLPSGIEAGLVGGLAVAAVFLVRDVIAGVPMQTPSVLGTLMFEGPEAAREAVSEPGAAIAYNAVHFAIWIVAGVLGNLSMRQVDASESNWYRPWVGAGVLLLLSVFASLQVSSLGLPMLRVWLGMFVGVVAMACFLGWRHPRAMQRVRQMGGP